MREVLDIHVSPCVKGAHVFKVPCSFSPTGIHYITLMMGEKTAVSRKLLTTKPHLLYMSCECLDTVPPDMLEGMISLREVAAEEGQDTSTMCLDILKMAREAFHCATDDYNARNKRDRLLTKLPLPMQPVVKYLTENRREHPAYLKKRNPMPSIGWRAAKRFTEIFNASIDTPGAFTIKWVRGVGFGLANDNGEVLAYRQHGGWFLPKGWFDSTFTERWSSYVEVEDMKNHCTICEKKFGGGNPRNLITHSASSEAHASRVRRKVKIALVATQYFPYIMKAGRPPRNFSKHLNVKEISGELFLERFVRKASDAQKGQ